MKMNKNIIFQKATLKNQKESKLTTTIYKITNALPSKLPSVHQKNNSNFKKKNSFYKLENK